MVAIRRRSPRARTPLLLAMLVFGCGSRTELSTISSSPAPLVMNDPCASAVLAHAAKPMTGSCSTRDGRARGVSAPKSPHVIWQTPIPYVDDVTSIDRQTTLVTDDAHHAYVGSFATIGGRAPLFRAVDTRTGAVEWAVDPAESKNGLALFLPQDGSVDLATGGSPANLAWFRPTSSTLTASSLLPFSTNQLGDPAIGTDGSLYFFYMTPDETTSEAQVYALRPDLSPAWASTDLTKTGPLPVLPALDNVLPMRIALGPGDTVYAAMTVTSTDGPHAVVSALNPGDGAVLWTKTFHGNASPPVIAADGSIGTVIAENDSSAASFVVLDPSGVVLHSRPLPGATAVIAVTVDGNFIVDGGSTRGSGVTAVDADGNVLWALDVDVDDSAVIADNGIVIVKGESEITAIDLKTGAIVWQLAPPVEGTCIASGTLALTSDGAVIALQCDGTLFAAAD